MSFQIRKRQILKFLQEKENASVKELADFLSYSEVTIRRDLTKLKTENAIVRTHGGVLNQEPKSPPLPFNVKITKNLAEKTAIAKLAADQIEDGDIVFLDCGSTVFLMCQFLKTKKIKVITNSLPVVSELFNSEVDINLVGGELDKARQAVHGKIALSHLEHYQVDKAFIGADGVDIKTGLTAKSETDAEMGEALLAKNIKTFVLVDKSKIGKVKYLKFAKLKSVYAIISNLKKKECNDLKKHVKVLSVSFQS